MKTVVENRHGMDITLEKPEFGYAHMSQCASQSKSCFYDFGERRRMIFVVGEDEDESEFIESLAQQYCVV